MSQSEWNACLYHVGMIIGTISIWPLILFIRQYSRMNRFMRLVALYIVTMFLLLCIANSIFYLSDFLKPILTKYNIKNTWFTNILFQSATYLLLGPILYEFVRQRRILYFIILYSTFGLVYSWVVVIFIQDWREYSLSCYILAICYDIIIATIGLYFATKSNSHLKLKNNVYFYFFLGHLIPAVGGFVQFIMTQYIYKNNIILFFKLQIAYNLLLLIEILLYTQAFRKVKFLPYFRHPERSK